jgi:uncharacterized protein involved in exopolysaccharide biosynthesis
VTETEKGRFPKSSNLPDGALANPSIVIPDLQALLLSRWRTLLAALVFGAVVGLALTQILPKTFTARTTILLPQPQQSAALAALQGLGALAGTGSPVKAPADQYAALMQSATIQQRLIEKFSLREVYEVRYMVDARRTLEERTRIAVGKRDGLISIEVDDRDPVRSAGLANAYVEQLRRLTSDLTITEAQARRAFFERQLSQTKARLAESERALQATGVNEGTLRAEPKAAAEGYARLKANVTAAEVKVQSMRGHFADGATELQQALLELRALRSQMLKAEASDSANANSDYLSRFREYKYQETLMDSFARQAELSRLDESREGTLIQLVDIATAPERKSAPRAGLVAVSGALACVLTALAILTIRAGRQLARVQNRVDLELTPTTEHGS